MNTYKWIIAVLMGVILVLAYLYQNKGNDRLEAIKIALKDNQRVIDSSRNVIIRLNGDILAQNQVVDSLSLEMNKTAATLKKKQKALNYYASKFQDFTNNERDSVLRDYIRANQ